MYIIARAANESQRYGLDPAFFAAALRLGTELFFGVLVDENGELVSDAQRPDFFEEYMQQAAGAG